MSNGNQLAVRPIISYPREAEVGKTYLLTIDLLPQVAGNAWPYQNREEVTVDCLLLSAPLFESQAIGEPSVVLHRFGGSYGPARFLLHAASEPIQGVLRIVLHRQGLPLIELETLEVAVRPHLDASPPIVTLPPPPRQSWPPFVTVAMASSATDTQGDAATSLPAEFAEDGTDDWAIVIGIGEYLRELPPLPAAVANAQAFARWLLEGTGGNLRGEQVQQLVSGNHGGAPSPHIIPRHRVDQILSAMISGEAARRGRGGRRLYLYFSGLCAPGDQNDVWLLTSDSVDSPGNAIRLSQYLDSLGSVGQFREVVAFVDGVTVSTRFFRPEASAPSVSAPPLGQGGAAESFTLVCYSPNEEFHGRATAPFTTALIQGLAGAARVSGSGEIGGSDLLSFIRERVASQGGKEVAQLQCRQDTVNHIKFRISGKPRPTYLLTWDPARTEFQSFESVATRVRESGTAVLDWSVGWPKQESPPQIAPGDRVFFMRHGRDRPGLIGSGVVAGEKYADVHWSEKWAKLGDQALYSPVRFEALRKFPIIPLHELIEQTNEGTLWTKDGTCHLIEPELARRLEELWAKAIHREGDGGALPVPPSDRLAFVTVCRELCKEMWEDPKVQSVRRRAALDAGVDIIIGQDHGKWIGVLCQHSSTRQEVEFNAKQLNAAIYQVKDFEPALFKCILVTSGLSDTSSIQFVRRLIDDLQRQHQIEVLVWFWPDVWAELSRHTKLRDRLRDTCWPDLPRNLEKTDLGDLYNVPELPHDFRPVSDDFGRIKAAILADGSRIGAATGNVVRVGISGRAGTGKTVLASALARDSDIRRTFPDGVFWLTMGPPSSHLDLLNQLASWIPKAGGPFGSLSKAQTGLRHILSGRNVLLILDQVEEVEQVLALNIVSAPARLLLIAQSQRVLRKLDAEAFLLASPPVDAPKLRIDRPTRLVKIYHQRLDSVISELATTRAIKVADEGLNAIPPLWVDRNLIGDVLYECLMSAVAFGSASSRILVRGSVESAAKMYTVKFVNHAASIRDNDREAVFSSHFRRASINVGASSQTELGLYMSRQVVRAHGGDLELTHRRSPVEFTLSLPSELARRAPPHSKHADAKLRSMPHIDATDVPRPGGAMSWDSRYYVEREQDAKLREIAGLTGQTIMIYGPRQMGKTSLMWRYLFECERAEKRAIRIDFGQFSEVAMKEYSELLSDLADVLGSKCGIRNRRSKIRGPQELEDFISEQVIPSVRSPIALGFDEADRVLSSPYSSDFFALLRSWHDERARTGSVFTKIDLVLVSCASPARFIQDPLRSPFNVGQFFRVTPFNREECEILNRRFNELLTIDELSSLWTLLEGHPYLTQLAYYSLVGGSGLKFDTLLAQTLSDGGPFRDHLWMQEERIRSDPALAVAMREVIDHGRCAHRDAISRLIEMGLVRQDSSVIVPTNSLYRRYFARVLPSG